MFSTYGFRLFDYVGSLRQLFEILDESNLDWQHNELHFHHAIRAISDESFNRLKEFLPQSSRELDHLDSLRCQQPPATIEAIKEFETKLDNNAAEEADPELAYEYEGGKELLDTAINDLERAISNSRQKYLKRHGLEPVYIQPARAA